MIHLLVLTTEGGQYMQVSECEHTGVRCWRACFIYVGAFYTLSTYDSFAPEKFVLDPGCKALQNRCVNQTFTDNSQIYFETILWLLCNFTTYYG